MIRYRPVYRDEFVKNLDSKIGECFADVHLWDEEREETYCEKVLSQFLCDERCPESTKDKTISVRSVSDLSDSTSGAYIPSISQRAGRYV